MITVYLSSLYKLTKKSLTDLHFFLSLSKIKDSIVDAWSAVNVSELQQVSQVSAVVASVADKRNELSIESQVRFVYRFDLRS